jgi:hypothetical protein
VRVAHDAVIDWIHIAPYPATFNLADLAVRGGLLVVLADAVVRSVRAETLSRPEIFVDRESMGGRRVSQTANACWRLARRFWRTSCSPEPLEPFSPAAASSTSLVRSVGLGAGAGVIASLVMAGYAMIASATYQHTGFFTPHCHIASTFITPNHRMMSAQSAMGGSTFVFYGGPAVLGAVIHVIIGAMYGALFGALVALTRLRGMMLVAAGAVWGAAVFVISSFIGLPLAAAVFGSGDQITHMAKMVDYPTFLAEQVLVGLALGLLMLALAGRRTSR